MRCLFNGIDSVDKGSSLRYSVHVMYVSGLLKFFSWNTTPKLMGAVNAWKCPPIYKFLIKISASKGDSTWHKGTVFMFLLYFVWQILCGLAKNSFHCCCHLNGHCQTQRWIPFYTSQFGSSNVQYTVAYGLYMLNCYLAFVPNANNQPFLPYWIQQFGQLFYFTKAKTGFRLLPMVLYSFEISICTRLSFQTTFSCTLSRTETIFRVSSLYTHFLASLHLLPSHTVYTFCYTGNIIWGNGALRTGTPSF